MRVSELLRLLQEIQAIHGDIQVRCGAYRIAGIQVIHSVTPGGSSVAVLLPRVTPTPVGSKF